MKLSENTKMGKEWKDWFQSHSVKWSEVDPHDVLTYLRQARRLSESTLQRIECLRNNEGQKRGANLMAAEVQRLGNKAIVTFMVALRKADGYDELLKEVCAVMPMDLREAIEKELQPSEKLGSILESGSLGDIPAPAVSTTTNITCKIANIQQGNHNTIHFRRDPENTGEDLDGADNYGNHGDGMNDRNDDDDDDDDDDINDNDISGNDNGDETQSNTDNNENEEVARNIAPDIVAEKNEEVTSNIAPVIVAQNVAIQSNVEISGNDFSSSAQNNLGATGGASEHDKQGECDNVVVNVNGTAIKEITETTKAISMSRQKEIAPSYQSSRPSEFSGVERDASLRSQVSQSNGPHNTRDGQPDLFRSSLGNREESSGVSGGRDRFPTGDRDERSSVFDQRDGENNPSVRSGDSLSSNNTNDGRPTFLSNLSDWQRQNIPATVPANISLTSSLGAGERNAGALNLRDFHIGTGSQQNPEGDITPLETDGSDTASAATSGLDSFNSGESEGLDNLAVAGQPVDSIESNSYERNDQYNDRDSSSAIIAISFAVGAVALFGYMIYKYILFSKKS